MMENRRGSLTPRRAQPLPGSTPNSTPRPSYNKPGPERPDDLTKLKKLYDSKIDKADGNADYTDHIYCYMRLREEEREQYLKDLGSKAAKRVKNDIDRIRKLRIAFFANPTKKGLVEDHLIYQNLWKNEARGRNRDEFLKDLNERKSHFERKFGRGKENRVDGAEVKNTKNELRPQRLLTGLLGRKEGQEVEKIHSTRDENHDTYELELENRRARRKEMFKNEERILESVSKWKLKRSSTASDDTKEKAKEEQVKAGYNVNGAILYFPGEDDKTFTLRKTTIDELLNEDDPSGPIFEPPGGQDGQIRYFHLPTNNMEWVEKFIKIYYSKHEKDKKDRGPAERLLGYQNWEGQIHGGTEHPVHARHMRPRCLDMQRDPNPLSAQIEARIKRKQSGNSNVTSPTAESISNSSLERPTQIQNFSLFMPYLHWEIKSRQIKMAEVISSLNKSKTPLSRTTQAKEDARKREEQRKQMEQEKKRFASDWTRLQYLTRFEKEHGHLPKTRSKHLGNYLLSVARVAEQMEFEADERLLRNFLHKKSPLHVRRTLDQSYFWTLQDTATRDRDQVVYRGTRGGRRPQGRIVMVDQLWMWILDEHTILTSFPRRWGRNKPDSSGVHKSLRDRLALGEEEIKSVFDLALVIIDQCSRVFFDRTKPRDNRPEVMDIFGNAVASLTHKKTDSYELFWSQSEKDLSSSHHQVTRSHRSYLNINPEGALLRECEDVIEELHMMRRIFIQQSQVVKDFKKALDKINANYEVEKAQKQLHDDEPRVDFDTILRAQELVDHIDERKSEIENLEMEAKRTNQQLHNLLALKQQQASIIEARLALERAVQANSQGRSVMLFTVVTILFLPLSFFTSLFGMNNSDWTNNLLSLHEQLRLMLPISFAVIFVSLMIAFNSRTRERFAALYSTLPHDFMAKYTPFRFFVGKSPLNKIDQDYNSAMERAKHILVRMGENRRTSTASLSELEDGEGELGGNDGTWANGNAGSLNLGNRRNDSPV